MAKCVNRCFGFLCGVFFACALCASGEDAQNVLADAAFARGVMVTGVGHDEPVKEVRFSLEDEGEKESPCWRIAQWHSRGKLEHTEVTREKVTLRDAFKSVTFNRKTGAVTLTADASRDYEKQRESAAEPWVHLLLEQGYFARAMRCVDAEAIIVEAELELTRMDEKGPQNMALHAAQFSWFLYLKNQEENSPGWHDFLWFGLSIFDSRRDFTQTYAAQDFAVPAGKFIYNVGSEETLAEKVVPGKRFTIRRDILPDIKKAVAAAHTQGFIPHSTADDFMLDGMNIGWEITGMTDAGMTIHRMEVKPVMRNAKYEMLNEPHGERSVTCGTDGIK